MDDITEVYWQKVAGHELIPSMLLNKLLPQDKQLLLYDKAACCLHIAASQIYLLRMQPVLCLLSFQL